MTSITWLSGNRGAQGWTLTTSCHASVCNHVARVGCCCNRSLLCTTDCSWFERTQIKLWRVWSGAKWCLLRRVLKLRYHGTRHRVIWWRGTKVPEESANSIRPRTFYPEDEGSRSLWNVGTGISNGNASQKFVTLTQNASQRLWAMAIWTASCRLSFVWRYIKVIKTLFFKHSEH
jgi:hypothetical protein